MSYNTRRAQGYSTPQSAQVGQRRPAAPSGNFVSGGQLDGSQQQQKPQQQQQQQQRPQQGGILKNQGQQQTPVKQTKPIVPGANPPPPDNDEAMEYNEDGSPKKKWIKRGKISRSERVRRRNMKLSKILQPKNAVMILNELIKGCVYQEEELKVKTDENQYRGTVQFDGQEFAGTGRTKIAAKNAAAETALKHLVKHKELLSKRNENGDADGDEQMDTGEENQVMPWSHIASFAMYKLFSTWGEDPAVVTGKESGNKGQAKKPFATKPAKEMPPNPETMNPIMLLHQMYPGAVWEDLGKIGTGANTVITLAVTIDGKKYKGSGSNKKVAKKQAAFAACHEHLKVTYAPDVYTPNF